MGWFGQQPVGRRREKGEQGAMYAEYPAVQHHVAGLSGKLSLEALPGKPASGEQAQVANLRAELERSSSLVKELETALDSYSCYKEALAAQVEHNAALQARLSSKNDEVVNLEKKLCKVVQITGLATDAAAHAKQPALGKVHPKSQQDALHTVKRLQSELAVLKHKKFAEAVCQSLNPYSRTTSEELAVREDECASLRKQLKVMETSTHDSAASGDNMLVDPTSPLAIWQPGFPRPTPVNACRLQDDSCAAKQKCSDCAESPVTSRASSLTEMVRPRVEWPEAVSPWSEDYVWQPGELIGKGGWSTVLPCRRRDGIEGVYPMAVKVTEYQDNAHVFYLRHEAEILRRLGPVKRVVNVDGFFVNTTDKIAYLTMQRLTGRSMRTLMTGAHSEFKGTFLLKRGQAALARHVGLVKEIAVELLKALAAIHKAGVAHLDIKQGNLMVSVVHNRLRVHLIDFGCAFDITTEHEMDDDVGTMDYEAPEVLRAWINRRTKQGPTVLTNPPAADLWSAGITLLEALFDGVPFSASGQGLDALRQQMELRTLQEEWGASLAHGGKHWVLRDLSQLGHDAVDFFVRLLAVDPCHRITARQALRHPWLASAL